MFQARVSLKMFFWYFTVNTEKKGKFAPPPSPRFETAF